MIETLDPNETKARVFHIGDDVECDSQRPGECHHVYPTARSARSHTKPCEQRAAQTKAKQHEEDDLWRMLFGRARAQASNLKKTVQRWKRQGTRGTVVRLGASQRRGIP